MAQNIERVENALSSLVDRTLQPVQDQSEEDADERFYTALDAARDTLQTQRTQAKVTDVGRIYELIKEKLVRENDTPESALRFSNLYSRLLSLPVLKQQWAILHLLYQLSESGSSDLLASHREGLQYGNSGNHRDTQHVPQTPKSSFGVSVGTNASQPQNGRGLVDEAFSRGGLSAVPTPREKTEKPERPSRQLPNPRRRELSIEPVAQEGGIAQKHRIESSPPELALLRDLPFTLQGVSSTNLTFPGTGTLMIPSSLSIPVVSLLHSLAEPALLYKEVSKWLESSDGGLIEQSLRSAMGQEARSYLGLVASLESQIRGALGSLSESQGRASLGKAGVTLKRCVLWTREATMGLRLMTLIVEETAARKGGQIISYIHSLSSSYGDAFVNRFAERLLTHVTKPFYDMLRSWIYDGELSDPYFEFFITENSGTEIDDNGRGGATSVWEDKYKLVEPMIPSIISEEFARKVFLIGKSLNFIRHGCDDSSWVENYSKEHSKELRYGDTALLEFSIDAAYKTTMSHLIHLMTHEFKLLEHLKALKKYLLLGQGDFIALLLESLSTNLDRPANSQYRHTLTAQLEHAIRNSNAQYDSPDVLRRLDARMLELSHGEIGWDVFTLEYKIDAPVDVVVTPYGSKQYLKVFNFLWRVKRVEYALSTTWRRTMTGSRGVLSSVADKVGKDWKTARCTIAEMVHFICQLQYYILFEVIEASWDQLITAISKPECTLDDLIDAHAKYLKSITRKGLLGSSAYDFTSQLHELLKTMLAYRDAVDGLYSFSVAEFTRRQEKAARIESRTVRGKWGITEKDDDDGFDYSSHKDRNRPRSNDADSPMPPPLISIGGQGGNSAIDEANVLSALRVRLNELATDFRTRISNLLGDLAYQPDTDMRFLGVVMNFNDVYKVVKRSRRGKLASGDDKKRERQRPYTADTASKRASSAVPLVASSTKSFG